MKSERILFIVLLMSAAYSLANLFNNVPFATGTSVLAAASGIVLIIAVFFDTYQTKAQIISSPIKILIAWVMSIISINIGFSSIYLELVRQDPNHFKGIIDGVTAAYFAVGTFATVGFGDVYPVSVTAKFMVMSEIMAAVILLPIMIGSSIAWFINHKIKQQDQEFIHRFKKDKPNQLIRIK